jgi:threonine synthase
MYVSCRDTASSTSARRRYSFREAVFSGWAEDGGMFVPEEIPVIPRATLSSWRQNAAAWTYSECCFAVLRRFVPRGQVPDEVLRGIVGDAFAGFGHGDVVCSRAIGGATVLELFHGPTLAFKDLGMQVLCKILGYFLEQSDERLNLLVGTSGDTGSSAIEAVKDIPRVTITVLYPGCNRIARLQELQMTTSDGANGVKVIAVDGTSDDLDVPMETLFGDVRFARTHKIGSVNSVNICRVLVQVAHFVWAAVTSSDGCDSLRFFVPTGAGGHVTAGAMARAMLAEDDTRIELHVATNENDSFHRILSTGAVSSDKVVTQSVAPSMDIAIPYNLERLMWLAAMEGRDGRDDHGQVERCLAAAKLMRSFKQTGGIVLPTALRQRLVRVCGITGSSRHSNASTLATIRAVNDEDGYVLDPHTATGVAAMRNMSRSEGTLNVCMACAHPAKFSKAIADALGSRNGGGGRDDPWWWLSAADRSHPSLARLLNLDREGGEPATELYARGTDWVARLRGWFEAQTEEQRRKDRALSKRSSRL